MKVLTHTSRELALRLKEMYPDIIILIPDPNGLFYVLLEREIPKDVHFN